MVQLQCDCAVGATAEFAICATEAYHKQRIACGTAFKFRSSTNAALLAAQFEALCAASNMPALLTVDASLQQLTAHRDARMQRVPIRSIVLVAKVSTVRFELTPLYETTVLR
jgi:hypothetical protein